MQCPLNQPASPPGRMLIRDHVPACGRNRSESRQTIITLAQSSGALFMPVNVLTKNGYTSINIVSLWVAAQLKGFSSPVWATYKQWSELGAQVRAGVKSSPVIFNKEFDAEPDPDVADDDGKPRVARASRVFNAAQVEGYALNPVPEPLGPVARIAGADAFVRGTGARIEHGGDRAFYRPSTDRIQMPPEEMF